MIPFLFLHFIKQCRGLTTHSHETTWQQVEYRQKVDIVTFMADVEVFQTTIATKSIFYRMLSNLTAEKQESVHINTES